MKTLLLAVLASMLSGCAVVFQGPSGKSCLPYWGHVCHSLMDTDR